MASQLATKITSKNVGKTLYKVKFTIVLMPLIPLSSSLVKDPVFLINENLEITDVSFGILSALFR